MNLLRILIIGVLWIAAFVVRPAQKDDMRPHAEIQKSALPRVAATEIDTDGDGVKDWEEKLRGTDPNTPDAARKSAADEVVIRLAERRAEKMPTPTQTTGETRQETETPAVRTQKNSAVETAEGVALHSFGNALGAALAQVANDAFERQTQNTLNAVVNEGAKLATLAPLADSYRSAASALREVAPPAVAAGGAAALLGKIQSGYANVANALATLAATGGDKKQQGENWMRYSDAVLALGQALNETIGFFRERNISFSPSEPGSLFSAF